MARNNKCKNCKCFDIDQIGSKGGIYGTCKVYDHGFRHKVGWRLGSSKACSKFNRKEK